MQILFYYFPRNQLNNCAILGGMISRFVLGLIIKLDQYRKSGKVDGGGGFDEWGGGGCWVATEISTSVDSKGVPKIYSYSEAVFSFYSGVQHVAE